jgi:hypothetical protein
MRDYRESLLEFQKEPSSTSQRETASAEGSTESAFFAKQPMIRMHRKDPILPKLKELLINNQEY